MEVYGGEELQNALSFTDENFFILNMDFKQIKEKRMDTVMKRKRVEQRPIHTMTHQQRFY